MPYRKRAPEVEFREMQYLLSLALMFLICFNQGGKSNLLVMASTSGNNAAVKLLISAGAEVNRIAMNETPLIAASKANNPNTVEILLQNGAKVGLTGTNGKTALSVALEKHNTAIVNLLRAAGGR